MEALYSKLYDKYTKLKVSQLFTVLLFLWYYLNYLMWHFIFLMYIYISMMLCFVRDYFLQTKKWPELEKLGKDQEVKFVTYVNGIIFPSVLRVYYVYLYGFFFSFTSHLKCTGVIVLWYVAAGS